MAIKLMNNKIYLIKLIKSNENKREDECLERLTVNNI